MYAYAYCVMCSNFYKLRNLKKSYGMFGLTAPSLLLDVFLLLTIIGFRYTCDLDIHVISVARLFCTHVSNFIIELVWVRLCGTVRSAVCSYHRVWSNHYTWMFGSGQIHCHLRLRYCCSSVSPH